MRGLGHLALVLALGCATTGEDSGPTPRVRVARLAEEGVPGLEELSADLRAAAPGYDVAWHAPLRDLGAEPWARVAFVQAGQGLGRVTPPGQRSPIAVGDVLVLRAGASLVVDGEVDALVFRVPEDPPPDVPPFVRPDHDPGITDVAGGCATEAGAYRRLCLTWRRADGPYVFRGLNAHRVKIVDSFTHYHPVEGGFDELYLVQERLPGGRLVTSDRLAAIVAEDVGAHEVGDLLESRELRPGDLVWLPRGTVHRGLGGVVAHVIAIPGFVPGAEIGVDRHLAALNVAHDLTGEAALPVHAAAPAGP